MEKKIINIIVVAVIVAVIAGIFWRLHGIQKEVIESGESSPESEGINQSQGTGSGEETNNTESNESKTVEPTDDSVPNPSGSLNWIDERTTEGGYLCNYTNNSEFPKHQAKLYTYRIINGNKTLSDDYIESEKVEDVCDYYDNSSNVRYNMRWEWKSVEGIDGYRIYQYYFFNNSERNYDYYIELGSIATRLQDTGLDLWKRIK